MYNSGRGVSKDISIAYAMFSIVKERGEMFFIIEDTYNKIEAGLSDDDRLKARDFLVEQQQKRLEARRKK